MLNFLRSGDLPPRERVRAVYKEAQYYAIGPLLEQLENMQPLKGEKVRQAFLGLMPYYKGEGATTRGSRGAQREGCEASVSVGISTRRGGPFAFLEKAAAALARLRRELFFRSLVYMENSRLFNQPQLAVGNTGKNKNSQFPFHWQMLPSPSLLSCGDAATARSLHLLHVLTCLPALQSTRQAPPCPLLCSPRIIKGNMIVFFHLVCVSVYVCA